MGGEMRRLLRIAAPLMVGQLGQVGMSTADTIMVGPLGASSIAAIGIGSAVHFAFMLLCIGTVMGMGPLVSQAYGAGDRERCARVLIEGLWLSLYLSIPMIVFSLFGTQVISALGQKPEVALIAGGYMRALSWGVLPFIAFTAYRQYLEGMGHTAPTMFITLMGLATNIVANYAFIHGVGDWIPAMGAVGTGHATSLTRWVMIVAMWVYLVHNKELNPFADATWGPQLRMLRQIVRVGLPIGGQFGLEVGLFSLAAVMMGWFGATELAAHQVTINIASTTFMVALGACLAGSVRVGQHIGARRPRMARRAALCTYALSIGFMGTCGIVFIVAPQALLHLYTDDPAILRVATSLLMLAAAFQLFDGAQAAGISILRGAADTRVPMAIGGLSYWLVGLPAAYLIGFHTPLRAAGVWVGLTISLVVVALLLGARVRRILWTHPIRAVNAAPAAMHP
jgi:multidrug resistance protein, MATE family